jgi:hypothetical protein
MRPEPYGATLTRVFHVELRQFPNSVRAFNLTREELMARIVGPWVSGVPVEWGERRWNPEKARIAIYEGRNLGPEEIGLGRGWQNATRSGQEVTAQVLEEARVPPALERFKEEVCAQAPVALTKLVELAGESHPQARLSDRLALAEQAVWQLLHEQRLALRRDGEPLPSEDWGPTLLSWEAWRDGQVTVEGL